MRTTEAKRAWVAAQNLALAACPVMDYERQDIIIAGEREARRMQIRDAFMAGMRWCKYKRSKKV